jgi:hypothetical protein
MQEEMDRMRKQLEEQQEKEKTAAKSPASTTKKRVSFGHVGELLSSLDSFCFKLTLSVSKAHGMSHKCGIQMTILGWYFTGVHITLICTGFYWKS